MIRSKDELIKHLNVTAPARARRRALHTREAIRIFNRLERPLTQAQLEAVPTSVRVMVKRYQRVAFGPEQVLTIAPPKRALR